MSKVFESPMSPIRIFTKAEPLKPANMGGIAPYKSECEFNKAIVPLKVENYNANIQNNSTITTPPTHRVKYKHIPLSAKYNFKHHIISKPPPEDPAKVQEMIKKIKELVTQHINTPLPKKIKIKKRIKKTDNQNPNAPPPNLTNPNQENLQPNNNNLTGPDLICDVKTEVKPDLNSGNNPENQTAEISEIKSSENPTENKNENVIPNLPLSTPNLKIEQNIQSPPDPKNVENPPIDNKNEQKPIQYLQHKKYADEIRLLTLDLYKYYGTKRIYKLLGRLIPIGTLRNWKKFKALGGRRKIPELCVRAKYRIMSYPTPTCHLLIILDP